jgi:hypothetical protein
MFLEGLTPLLEFRVENRNVLFSFHTGATGTIYSARYAKEFLRELKNGQRRTQLLGGGGGSKSATVTDLSNPQLQIGNTTVTLHNIGVMPPLGTTADKILGNLGLDVVKPYSSFTLDFVSMRFRLGDKL